MRYLQKFFQVLIILSVLTGGGQAQTTRLLAQEAPAAKSDSKENVESPRYMLRQFMNVMKREDVEAALTFMEFPKRWNMERKRRTTRELIDVLNKKGRIDITDVSNEPDGKLNDSQPPEIEVIGQAVVSDLVVPVTLVRVQEEEHKVWRFAPEFIDQVPVLTEKMEQSDIEADIPPFLVKYQFRGIKAWQWLGLMLAIVLAALVSRILALVLLKLVHFTSRRFKIYLTDEVLKGFIPPLRMLSGLGVFHLALESVDLNLAVRQTVQYGISVVFTCTLIFLALRLTEACIAMVRISFERQSRQGSVAMLPPTQKGIKTVVVAIGIIFLLRDLGFDVTAIVAGLGVGGLAVALAGQKTIENLFGGISVILDQPVRVGDTGRFGDIVGTVEDIGLRSTRVRTLDRSVVTIPNAEFSHMKLENFERRDKLRWATNLILRYDTSADQLRYILIKIKEIMIGHPMVMNEPSRVRFVRFGLHGFEVEMFCYVRSTDWNEYLAVVEDLNIRILRVVEESGAGFAFPGATLRPEVEEGLMRQRQLEAEAKIQELEKAGGFPMPLYPQEWIEPRTDTLGFGAVKTDVEGHSG